jgi:hypothetical protein
MTYNIISTLMIMIGNENNLTTRNKIDDAFNLSKKKIEKKKDV